MSQSVPERGRDDGRLAYRRARRFAEERAFVALRRAAPARFAGAFAFALRTVLVDFFFIALAIVFLLFLSLIFPVASPIVCPTNQKYLQHHGCKRAVNAALMLSVR
jgi:hypothetical protein